MSALKAMFEKKIDETIIELAKPEIQKSPEKVKKLKKDLSNLFFNLMNVVESKGYRKRQKENIKISVEEYVKGEGKEIGEEIGEVIGEVIKKVKKQESSNKMTSLSISRVNKEALFKIKRKAEDYNGTMNMNELITIIIWNYINIFRDNFDYTQR